MRKIIAIILVVMLLLPCIASGEEIKAYGGNESFYSTIRKISFMDMAYKPVDHWSKDAVYTVAALSIMNGSDGNFNPDDNLTRAEALAMIFRAAGLENTAKGYNEVVRKQKLENPEKFNDVCDWADGYLRLAVDYKLISTEDYTAAMAYDYSKASFRKDEPATKGEVALWMVSVFQLELSTKENYVTEFNDVPAEPSYSRLYYETAIKNGILKGDGTNLGVSNLVTREEAAQMFLNSVELYKDKLGFEIVKDIVVSNDLASENEKDKIKNKRTIKLEKMNLEATRTYDLIGEAVDLNYNPENEYKDIVVVKHNSLPQGIEALNQGDVVNVYIKNGQAVLVTCFSHKAEVIKRDEADYVDSDAYSGNLYYVDNEERMVVIKDKSGNLVEIPYFDDAIFCNRDKTLTVEELNSQWVDKEIYVFTIIKKTGTVSRAYRIQLVDKGE